MQHTNGHCQCQLSTYIENLFDFHLTFYEMPCKQSKRAVIQWQGRCTLDIIQHNSGIMTWSIWQLNDLLICKFKIVGESTHIHTWSFNTKKSGLPHYRYVGIKMIQLYSLFSEMFYFLVFPRLRFVSFTFESTEIMSIFNRWNIWHLSYCIKRKINQNIIYKAVLELSK